MGRSGIQWNRMKWDGVEEKSHSVKQALVP